MKKNNKGFTLIELLAVIVILAILILMAMPRVIQLMEQARKNSFKVEVQSILREIENVYADKMLNGKIESITQDIGTDSADKNVPTRYLCMNLRELYEQGYMSKDFSNSGYSGFVEIFVPSKGLAVYGINISNGSYSFRKATPEKLANDSTAIASMGTETSLTETCKTTGAGAVAKRNDPTYKYLEYKN